MSNKLQLTAMKLLAVAVIAASAAAYPGIASAQDDQMTDLGAITCKDVLLASGEDRDAVILVVHAYLLGEAKQLTYNDNVLGGATDRFLEACIAAPDTQALATMRKQLKAAD